MSARCDELIVAEETRGKGIEADPYRRVIVVYNKKGDRLAENDPYAPVYNMATGEFKKEQP